MHALDQVSVDGAEAAEAHIDQREIINNRKMRRIKPCLAAHAAFQKDKSGLGQRGFTTIITHRFGSKNEIEVAGGFKEASCRQGLRSPRNLRKLL